MALGDHATYFRIKNFKGFADLEVENIGWVNLIVGDNNVGKTSLLEALHFHSAENGMDAFRHRLIQILSEVRGVQQTEKLFLDFFINRSVSDPGGIQGMELHMKHRNAGEVVFSLEYDGRSIVRQKALWKDPNASNGSSNQSTGLREIFNSDSNHATGLEMDSINAPAPKVALPYIPVNRGYAPDLVSYYSLHIQQHAQIKRQMLEDLQILIPSLESFEPSQLTQPATLVLFLSDSAGSISLPMMGEGAIKLFRILAEVIVWKGQRLMIDEIDTGFHHSRMRPFWKTLLSAARRHETQIFATTHNLECIQHLLRTLQEDLPEFQEHVRVIRLARVRSGIKAYTYPYAEFESAIENENELR
jgi:hypothetical protein